MDRLVTECNVIFHLAAAVGVVSVSLGVVGQLSLKLGMNRVGAIDSGSLALPMQTMLRVFSIPLVWLGLACYGVSAMLWLVILC